MSNSERIPKRRFSDFDGEWEQEKFGKIATIINGRAYSQHELLSKGKYKVLRVGNFYTNESWYYSNLELDSKYYANNGDLLYTWSATFGPHIWGGDKVIYHYHIWKVELSDRIDKHYALQLLEKDKSDILSNKNGSTMVHITKDGMENKLFMFPEKIEEQTKIGSFLRKLDQCIALHHHKLDKLKNLKKSYLAELFPSEGERVPKRRFSGFEGEWKKLKWVDTVDISKEMVNPTTGEYDDMPHIAPGNIESFSGRILDNVKTVRNEQLISGKFRFRPGDIVYGKINPQLGKYFYARIDGLTSADAYVLNSKNGLIQEFLFSLIQRDDFYNYSVSVSKRSGMPKINRDELNDYCYLAPNEIEQKQIGLFLLNIDNLLTLQQKKLDKLKNLKKAYLNELFV